MTPVEIIEYQGALVLRARGSELIILPNFVHTLQNTQEPKEFAKFFLGEALVNRPARKLFDSWLRKDLDLWKKIYHKVHKDMEKVNLEENPIALAMAKKESEKAGAPEITEAPKSDSKKSKKTPVT
jgi:hypothetical protein